MSVILTILGLVSPLTRLAGEINETKRAAIAAETDAERLAQEERLARLTALRDVMLAEQSGWLTRIVRPLIAFPFVVYIWKLIVWDKVLGLGTTDPLTGQIAEWAGPIIMSYFLVEVASQVTGAIRRR